MSYQKTLLVIVFLLSIPAINAAETPDDNSPQPSAQSNDPPSFDTELYREILRDLSGMNIMRFELHNVDPNTIRIPIEEAKGILDAMKRFPEKFEDADSQSIAKQNYNRFKQYVSNWEKRYKVSIANLIGN